MAAPPKPSAVPNPGRQQVRWCGLEAARTARRALWDGDARPRDVLEARRLRWGDEHGRAHCHAVHSQAPTPRLDSQVGGPRAALPQGPPSQRTSPASRLPSRRSPETVFCCRRMRTRVAKAVLTGPQPAAQPTLRAIQALFFTPVFCVAAGAAELEVLSYVAHSFISLPDFYCATTREREGGWGQRVARSFFLSFVVKIPIQATAAMYSQTCRFAISQKGAQERHPRRGCRQLIHSST